MAVALSLLLDGATADLVRRLWVSVADAGGSRDMLDLGYPPHLTLLVVEDDGRAPELIDALPLLVPLVPGSLELGEVRQFEGTSVTWLSSAADPRLDHLHAAAARAVPTEAIHPHYRAGAWTPHVTLAVGGPAERVLDRARLEWNPGVVARIARLDVARFPPAESIAGIDLPAK